LGHWASLESDKEKKISASASNQILVLYPVAYSLDWAILQQFE
jgi:hypothetical protein